MTLEEKKAKLLAAKRQIYNLRSQILYCIERRERTNVTNGYIKRLNKAYLKYNQLRLKYWIVDESRIP